MRRHLRESHRVGGEERAETPRVRRSRAQKLLLLLLLRVIVTRPRNEGVRPGNPALGVGKKRSGGAAARRRDVRGERSVLLLRAQSYAVRAVEHRADGNPVGIHRVV